MGETLSPTTNGTTNKRKMEGKQSNKSKKEDVKPDQKSLFVAYVMWLFGGMFGLHHIYLHRDFHAFVHWSTFAGYFGIGWLADLFKIPAYLRDYNEDEKFIKEFVGKLQTNQRPPFSTYRFMAAICTAFLWGNIALIAIPQSDYFIDLSYLHWIIPLMIALGKLVLFLRCSPMFEL